MATAKMFMQLTPGSTADWVKCALLPAKVLLVVGVALVMLDFPTRGASPDAGTLLAWGFSLSLLLLLLGALIQSIFCPRGSATRTLLFLGLVLAAAYCGRWGGAAIVVIVPVGWLMLRFIRFTSRREAKVEEPVECMECHAAIGAGQSRCSACGWTFSP